MNGLAFEARRSISERFDRLGDEDVAPFLEAHRHELGDELVESLKGEYRLYTFGVCCKPRIPVSNGVTSSFGF
jgi:hypothetical protein